MEKEQPAFLKASVQIGTIHGRVNYRSKERAFHSSDVNEEKRRIKVQVKNSSRKDILGIGKKEWETSVKVEKPVERRQLENFKHDPTLHKFNYRAEVLQKTNTHFVPKCGRHEFDVTALVPNMSPERHNISTPFRVKEAPVHPDLEGKVAWDASTSFDVKQSEANIARFTTRANTRSRQKNKRLDREGYINPTLQQQIRMQELREEKERRAKGISTANMQESKVDDIADNQDRPSNRTRPTPSRKYKEYYNDGVYEYSKIEGCHVWSCSMNPNPEFRGSCHRVRNPDAWNFASP